MKKILVVLFCAIFTVSITSAQGTKKKDNKVTTKFFVESIHCDNCIKSIEKNIAFEKGVTDLKCDLDSKTVEVTYRSDRTTDEKLIAAFSKLKREARVLKDGEKPEIKHDEHEHEHQH